ncbi:MAG: XRN 5'-3' exonuclease, partial [Harvfovirus sp.]
KENRTGDLVRKIAENTVSREKFLNRYEQMLYIIPLNRISPVIPGYEKLLENRELFPDMEQYVNKIYSEKNTEEYIDCRRITFITKCILKKVKNFSEEEFMKIVSPYRKYLEKSGIDFTAEKENYEVMYDDGLGEGELSGGSTITSVLYKKELYKELYLLTGDLRYRGVYKKTKKQLRDLSFANEI